MDNVELDKFLNNLNVSRFYTYTGSLTEPPCTPGIKWIIIPEIQSFSPEQKCAINGCVGDDNDWCSVDYLTEGIEIYYPDSTSSDGGSM